MREIVSGNMLLPYENKDGLVRKQYMVYNMDVKQIICEKFNKHFSAFEQILIYGSGKMTECLIEDFPEQVCAVMDYAKIGEQVFGKQVLSFDEAKKSGVKVILIAARSANVKIIYDRIKDDCREHGFTVYDINGLLLSQAEIKTANKNYQEELVQLYAHFDMAGDSLAACLGNGNWAVFIAPLVYKFIHWIKEESARFDIILLSARDGFLLDLIQRTWTKFGLNSRYFYISRSSALLANIENESDIIEAMHYPFSGSASELLISRFFVKKPSERQREETDEQYVLRHGHEILENAKCQRRNLLKYIQNLECPQNMQVGFVDLVSQGSILKWLSKSVDWEITGLFLTKMQNEKNASLPIISMFEAKNEFDEAYGFMKDYFLIESVFSSYEPTVKCFDAQGNPEFYKEYRTKEQISSLATIHKEIVDFGRHLKDAAFDAILPESVDKIFSHSAYFDVDTTFTVAVDEFCGRLT